MQIDLRQILSKSYWIVYAVLSLVVFGIFIFDYLITLDFYSTPNTKFNFSDSWVLNPLYLLMWLLSFLIPTNIVAWLLLFVIVLISGTAMHDLLSRAIGTKNLASLYFGGFLYAINPFVYARFMAGHTLSLLGYALFPLFIAAALSFFERSGDEKNKNKMLLMSFWFFIIGMTALQSLFIAVFAFGILFLWNLMKNENNVGLINRSIIIIISAILLNSYWIVPALTTPNSGIEQITEKDIVAFKSKPETGMNVLMTVASLYGFWRSAAYIQPNDILPVWLVYGLFFVILFLSVYGFIVCDKKWKVPMVVLAVIAFLLAVGSSWDTTAATFDYLFNNFAPMKVFREPQKLVSLIVFAYACFGAIGVNELMNKIKDKEKNKEGEAKAKKDMLWCVAGGVFAILILAVPFVYTPTMFNSFWGQIKPTQYPADWYSVNEFLNNDTRTGDFNVLFLPWHMYMDFKWLNNTDKRAANMAHSFFDRNTIIGDNVEVGGIYSTSTSISSKYLEFLFSKGNEGNLTSIGDKISILGVKYVLLTKESDYASYNFLFNQTDLELVKETENFYVFKNTKPAYKIYGANEVVSSSNASVDFEESLNKHLSEGVVPVNYSKTLFGYKIGPVDKKYVVLTDAFDSNWQFSGSGIKEHLRYIAVNGYELDQSTFRGGELVWNRYFVFLIGGLLTLITLAFLLWLWLSVR